MKQPSKSSTEKNLNLLEFDDSDDASITYQETQLIQDDLEFIETLPLSPKTDEQKKDSSSLPSSEPKKKEEELPINLFFCFYIGLCTFCIIMAVRFMKLFDQALTTYESATPEHYVEEYCSSLKDPESAGNYLYFPEITYSVYEDPNRLHKEYLTTLSNETLSFARSEEYTQERAIFHLYANQDLVGDIYLDSMENEPILGIFPTYKYFINHTQAFVDVTYQDYILDIPSTATVTINGYELDMSTYTSAEILPEFESYNSYTEVPKRLTFSIKGLIFEPEFHVYNLSHDEITYLFTQNKLYAASELYESTIPAELLISSDLLVFCELYSNFLSGDLDGKRYGFKYIRPYLYKDTQFYQTLRSRTEDDSIPQIAPHTLPDFIFSSENVSHFTMYTEDFFSCVVSLEKNVQFKDDKNTTCLKEAYQLYVVRNTLNLEDKMPWLIIDIKDYPYEDAVLENKK